ncbi:MAG: hypothetical protein KAS32_14715 [Candidatus Peribacteraceae bacterium]|nr:hypothetical protein [Candidatus Peribacteraceae bacterium]
MRDDIKMNIDKSYSVGMSASKLANAMIRGDYYNTFRLGIKFGSLRPPLTFPLARCVVYVLPSRLTKKARKKIAQRDWVFKNKYGYDAINIEYKDFNDNQHDTLQSLALQLHKFSVAQLSEDAKRWMDEYDKFHKSGHDACIAGVVKEHKSVLKQMAESEDTDSYNRYLDRLNDPRA